jgi:hypothetical protein
VTRWAPDILDKHLASAPCEVTCASHESAKALRHALYHRLKRLNWRNYTIKVKANKVQIIVWNESLAVTQLAKVLL